MKQFVEMIQEFLKRSKEDNISAYAAQAAFFLILSAFPFVILLLTLTRFLPVDQGDFIELLQVVLPGEIEEYALSILNELIAHSGSTIMSFSIIAALWSASRGLLSISNGLNSVYRTQESRNYFILRSIAAFHTLILLIAMVVLLVVFVFGNSLYEFISNRIPFMNDIATLIISVRVAVGFVLLFIMFIVMYKGLPSHKITVRQATPGALFSSVAWLLVSFGFSIYINHFSNYSNVYGSLTGIAIAMVWVYLMMSLALWGGEINAYIMEFYPERVKSRQKNPQKKSGKSQ